MIPDVRSDLEAWPGRLHRPRADAVDEAAIRAKSAEVAAVQADAAVLRARVRHDVFLIADTEGEARAGRLGLRTADRVTAPLGCPTLAWRALRAR